MTPSASPSSQQRNQLWEQGSRDAATALLRTFVRGGATLAELRHALAAAPVQAHRHTIVLREVLGPHAAPPPQPVHADAPAPTRQAPTRQEPTRQAPTPPRRRPQQGPQQRAALLAALRQQDAGMTTVALGAALRQAGLPATPVRINALLRACEADGEIVSLGGRPKTWKARVRGRSVPEPVVIRKAVDIRRAQAPAEPTPAAAAAPLPSVDPADIHAVAAILRRRFFAGGGEAAAEKA